MKRYKKYKDSGIHWIGEIPEHWEVKKLKYLAECALGKMLTNEDKGEYRLKPYLRAQNIRWFSVDISDLRKMWFSKEEIRKLKLKKNDLLVSEGGEVGRTCIWGEEIEECYIQNSVHRVRFEKYNPKYYLYHFFFSGNKGYFDSIVNQISIAHLTGEKLKDLLFLLPPNEEQSSIAGYLDRKTSLIDDLIAKKKRLVELLNEEKTAIINQAVTKGLDPNCPMKDSGIPWIGEIPEHWEVKKLKYVVTKVGSGVTPKGGASVYQQNGIPLLRSQNIHDDGLKLDDVAYISEDIDNEMSNSRIQENDILLNITGASIGRCFYIPKGFGKGNVNQHVCIIRPIQSKIKTKFSHSILISGYGETLIDICQTGANREGLNFQEIKLFDFPLPDIKEQNEVILYIDEEKIKISKTISKIEKEIELLHEYRASLISEVVTGKIDVRNVS